MSILAVCGTKGGIGKTSLCANLGGLIADWGCRVLLIDADPQSSLSNYFLIEQKASFGVTRIFSDVEINQAISRTSQPSLDIVLSDSRAYDCERRLHLSKRAKRRLKQALATLTDYDFVIIDTKGANDAFLEASILASDQILSPITPDMMSAREFMRGTLNAYRKLRRQHPLIIKAKLIFGVIYRYRRTVDATMLTKQIQSIAEENPDVSLLSTIVPDRIVYREAATSRVPVHKLETKRRGGLSANETMTSLALEVWPELSTKLAVVNKRPELTK